MKHLWSWMTRLLSGKPHFVIGDPERPYMLRWHLVPRNPLCNLYLHKFLRDDDDRALHDHPWWFLSIMVWGRYLEYRDVLNDGVGFATRTLEHRRAPSMVFRRPTDRHRVELAKRPDGTPRPCWTIILTGRKVRDWGFWCPRGFVPWQQFVSKDNKGEVGRGCD